MNTDYFDQQPRQFYSTSPGRYNALVTLPLGEGRDPDVLQQAIKLFKKERDFAGVGHALQRHEEFVPRGQRARLKSARARARLKKAAAKARARRERRGG